MYIDNFERKNNTPTKDDNISDFFSKEKAQEIPALEEPREKLIEKNSKDVLISWKAPEHEIFETDKRWYLYLSLILAAIVGYAIYTNSLIMAITFIMIGIVAYMHIEKEPRIIDFMITRDGIVAEKTLYPFENLSSFWIFYEPDGKKLISIASKSLIMPHIQIPIHQEDPVKIREQLIKYIPEVKQHHNITEILERILKI